MSKGEGAERASGWSGPTRSPVYARNAVATSHPLAVEAGLTQLREGGNAVDAALAAAIALTVVEPTSNGIGGDAFAIVWDGAHLHGLNGSGRSPAAWSPERFSGRAAMPSEGWDSVTVPGAVDAWVELSRRFGRRPLGALFAPAVNYAREGFGVPPVTAAAWAAAAGRLGRFEPFAETFLPGGRAPAAGETFACPAQADTLEEIAGTAGESFYRGALAEKIVACAEAGGGALSRDDLAAHRAEWTETIAQPFSGAAVHELPPNGQGLAALIALGLLKHVPAAARDAAWESPDALHLQVEAMKAAFAETYRHCADPDRMEVAPAALLDPEFLRRRARTIDRDRASRPEALPPGDRGTVYLAAADAGGMMVSFIQSNYWGFGSGVVVPGTGIALQNRGAGFSLRPGHPNHVDGGVRPFHTIMPGFALGPGGGPLLAFGVMGGHMQPQGHLQVLLSILARGADPQAALDAPRWHVAEDHRVALEPGFPPGHAEDLARRGHTLDPRPPRSLFGGGQAILNLGSHYCAGSDPRKDGLAAGF